MNIFLPMYLKSIWNGVNRVVNVFFITYFITFFFIQTLETKKLWMEFKSLKIIYMALQKLGREEIWLWTVHQKNLWLSMPMIIQNVWRSVKTGIEMYMYWFQKILKVVCNTQRGYIRYIWVIHITYWYGDHVIWTGLRISKLVLNIKLSLLLWNAFGVPPRSKKGWVISLQKLQINPLLFNPAKQEK